jgi:hypothetical protein
MATDGGVASKLHSAQKTLDNANKFQHSTGGPMYQHEYANAPYSLVHKPAKEVPTVGDELESKRKNVEQYVDAMK